MPEPGTRTETLRAGTPVAVDGVTLVPIERIVLHAVPGRASVWLAVAKEPYALVVRETRGLRAFDTGGTGISIEQLRAKIPGLDALLASM